MKTCPHCGGILLPNDGFQSAPEGLRRTDDPSRWLCWNDACPLNVEADRQRDTIQTAAAALGFFLRAGQLVLVVGAVYGAYLLMQWALGG